MPSCHEASLEGVGVEMGSLPRAAGFDQQLTDAGENREILLTFEQAV